MYLALSLEGSIVTYRREVGTLYEKAKSIQILQLLGSVFCMQLQNVVAARVYCGWLCIMIKHSGLNWQEQVALAKYFVQPTQ